MFHAIELNYNLQIYKNIKNRKKKYSIQLNILACMCVAKNKK